MNNDELKQLLANFYEGQTDEHEEQQIKACFEHDEQLTPELREEKKLFLALARHRAEPLQEVPDALEQKLARLIDEQAAASARPRPIRLATLRNRPLKWVAAILLLLASGWSLIHLATKPETPLCQDTFTDPKEAYKVLCTTLMEVSKGINEGMEQLAEVGHDIAQVRNINYNEPNTEKQ